ncbi:unnamed protein product [Malus baccata var. baccata]
MKRKRDENGDPLSRDLSCRESDSFFFTGDCGEDKPMLNLNIYCDFFALEEDHLQNLILREIEFGFEKDEDLVIPIWVLNARLESITWVLQRRRALGFHPRTAYLCMTYFDRFISLRQIPVNNKEAVVRLLSVACLSLAAKMEEQNIPSLSQYEVENPHLFEVKLIQRMELTVLGALEWKMNMITPFSFIDYFVSKLCQESLSDVKSKIAGLLLSIITEINSMHQRPSAVAAAATLMALDQKLTKEALELKINSASELKFLEISFLAKKETMDGGNDDDPLSPDLSCQENPEFLYDEVPVENPDDGINNLIDIEIGFGFQRDEALIIPNWVLEVRSESITWALNKTAAFGFQSSTVVYLFVTYFDRFISLTSIAMPIVEERPEIRLLSVACLSLAAWTERMMLPPLSQHEDGDYFFATGSIVQKAHGVVTALGWDMDIITPFAFLDYLVSKLWQEFPPDVKFQIAVHLRSVMTEINLMHHRPSAVAAAATLMALDQNLTNESLNVRISVPDLNFLETVSFFGSLINLISWLIKWIKDWILLNGLINLGLVGPCVAGRRVFLVPSNAGAVRWLKVNNPKGAVNVVENSSVTAEN